MLEKFQIFFPYVAYSIYAFAISAEYLHDRFSQKGVYFIKDSFVNLSTGLFAFYLPYVTKISIITMLYKMLHPFAITDLPGAWFGLLNGQKFHFFVFLFLFPLDDLCYYWYHRISHVVRVFWCIHEVHHSSEKYNFTVYFRASFLEYFVAGLFWIPMIIFGFTLEDILIQISVSLFYQFWLHSSHTKRIPIFDSIFNTPSRHRVHHSKNIQYLDKNFSAMFILWDKIFKTFAEEKGELNFGVLSPVDTPYNPFAVYTHAFKGLFKDIKSTSNITDKIKYIFYPPGWKHDGTGMTSKQLQANLHNAKC